MVTDVSHPRGGAPGIRGRRMPRDAPCGSVPQLVPKAAECCLAVKSEGSGSGGPGVEVAFSLS